VPISKYPDASTSLEDTVADMLRVIADLTDLEEHREHWPLQARNRDALEEMRQADRDAWTTVMHRLGDRDRELREGESGTTRPSSTGSSLMSWRAAFENRDRVDPHTFGRLVAQEVIQRLETADIVVVSRWRR